MFTYRTNRKLLLLAVLLLVFAASDFAVPNARAVVPLDLTPDDGVGNRACPGDFDNNGIVEFADFISLVAVFGASSGDANYNALMDLDGNGVINFGDFVLFAEVFGTTCEPPPAVARVTVSPSSASIEEGGTQQFSAAAYDSVDVEISGKTFIWSSDSASVATIDSSGLATGVDAGSTTITATVDGVSGTATLTVTESTPVVARVAVSPSSVSIEEGGTRQFSATAYDSDNTMISGKTFVWTSSSPSVATVNASGLATGVDAGSTTITATVDGVSGTATLTVTEPPPVVARVAVSPSSVSIEEGGTHQFSATAYDSDNTMISGKTFVWTSSSPSVATVNASGLATGVDAGSTTITATVDGVSGTATLTVTESPPAVARVAVSPSSVSIEEGGTHRFSATAYDSDNTMISGKTFAWSSSRASVATINSSGLAKGLDAGSTTITATVDGKSGRATLTVTEPPPVVARVTVSPSSVSIEEGGTHRFSATAFTSDNTMISGKTFAWSSSSPSVATINASGLAKGVDAGSTTITATVDGKSGRATLTVTEPPPPPPVVDRVAVSPSSASIEEGETQQFSATAYTSDNVEISGKTFSWSSSSISVATINASGLATAVDAGSTTIMATVDGKSGGATLTVTEPPPPPPVVDRVAVSPSSASIEEGETQQFSATAYTSDNVEISGKTFSWSSSMTSVATVSPSSGSATTAAGVDAGSTTITATVDGKSGTASLTVTEAAPRSRTGTIRGRNNYSSGGSVTLSETSDGKLRLSITGLSTPNAAPDVFVALYTSNSINWPRNGALPAGAVEFGEVSRQSGNKSWTFTPGSGKNIDSWSHLILHCRLINREVGSASLGN